MNRNLETTETLQHIGGRRRYTTPTLSAFGAVADLTRSDVFSCDNDGNQMGCITTPSNMGKMYIP